MQCPQCQAEIEADAAFCHQCGADLKAPADAAPEEPAEAEPTPHESFRKATAAHGPVDDDEDDVEDEIWQGSYSSKAMIGQWAAAALISVLAVAVAVMVPGSLWIVLGVVVLVWAVLMGWYAYRRFSVHYTLTTQRFIHESGMLWRTIDRVELIDIDDVTFKQGPVERVFRVGSIIVISGDKTSPELYLPGIDDVRAVADKIDDARRKERRRRGLHMITQGA